MDVQAAKPRLSFRIHGMDCAEEVTVLKREIGPLVGGESNLAFDILNGKMIVTSDAPLTSSVIQEAVSRTGMRADPWESAANTLASAGYWERNARITLTTLSGSCLVIAFLVHAIISGWSTALGLTEADDRSPFLVLGLYFIAILSGVWTVLPKAWIAAKRLRPDMNLLMVIAVVGAIGIGEWMEAATVAFLFAVSLTLEEWSVGRARRAVAALLDLTPPTARVRLEGGREEVVPIADVAVGTQFVLRPGDRIPLDGRVLEGASAVDQAPITGESLPVSKAIGETVFAGTINGDGALIVESTKVASDTTLARITQMVGEAQSRRAPSEQWVESFAKYYTPIVMAIAIVLLIVPPLLFGATWADSLYKALVLLVIACPCALVISTPVSIVAALAASARNGVLIKGGMYVESPASIQAIAFDKTGTLTSGKPVVVEVVPLAGRSEAELLERAAALESNSSHPLAHAILAYAKGRGVAAQPAGDFKITQGKGASGRFKGEMYWLGSHRYLEERGQETPEDHEKLETMSAAGRTVVVIGNDRHVCGFIALADTVKPNAKQALADLRALGIQHLVMLTGDNRGTADAIASQVGVDEVLAELLPEDKVKKVEELVARYGRVAMLGDGVNDAPALARATIGIAMGAMGSDAAIETADVALMSDDLGKLPWLVRHSRRTLSIIRQNIIFALSLKGLFVLLTFAGYSSMWAAIAADTGASLLVVFNGLRLLRT